MKFRTNNPVLVMGLAGVLALGVAACSFSSESSTTVETSTTEDGKTTTTTESTTTTSKTDENGTTTETTTTSTTTGDITFSYLNQYYGIGFINPEGFQQVEAVEGGEGETIDYVSADSAGDEAAFAVCKGVTSLDGVTDETSWANAYGESLAATLQENGETVTSAELGSVVIGDGKNATIYQIVSEANGATLYRSVIFMLDEDGDGLRVQFLATSQEMLQTLLDSIGSVSE